MPWKTGRKLHLATPDDAEPEVQEIYADFKTALRLPFVDELHQAYGACPRFLQEHWNLAGPIVRSKQFLSCAGRLAADAYTRVHSYMRIPDLCSELSEALVSKASRGEITECVDLFHRSSAYSLLLCSWQLRVFQQPVGEGAPIPGTLDARPYMPIIMREDAMSPETKKTLEEIRKKSDAPVHDTFYIAMARWPDLFQEFWKRVRIEMTSPMYETCKRATREYASQLCNELPGPAALTTSSLLEKLDEHQVGSLLKITEAFENSLSSLVLNIAWTRTGLEGGNTIGQRAAVPQEPPSPNAA